MVYLGRIRVPFPHVLENTTHTWGDPRTATAVTPEDLRCQQGPAVLSCGNEENPWPQVGQTGRAERAEQARAVLSRGRRDSKPLNPKFNIALVTERFLWWDWSVWLIPDPKKSTWTSAVWSMLKALTFPDPDAKTTIFLDRYSCDDVSLSVQTSVSHLTYGAAQKGTKLFYKETWWSGQDKEGFKLACTALQSPEHY